MLLWSPDTPSLLPTLMLRLVIVIMIVIDPPRAKCPRHGERAMVAPYHCAFILARGARD